MTKVLHKLTHLIFSALWLIKRVYPRSQYIMTAQFPKYNPSTAGLKVHQTIIVGPNAACTPIRQGFTVNNSSHSYWEVNPVICHSRGYQSLSREGKGQKFRFKRKRNLWDRDNSGTEYHDTNVWCIKTTCLVQVLSQAVFYCIYSALKNKTSLSTFL